MKNLLYFLVLLGPFIAMGQYDFDTRYFTINAASLPEAPKFDKLSELMKVTDEAPASFILDNTPTFEATLKSLRISSSNYWEPVDMRNASGSEKNFVDTIWETDPIKTKYYGTSGYSADGASKVTNTVYVEVSGLDLLSPCPPIGICPRCAPYRYNQNY